MIQYQIFSENEWVYPDTPITMGNKAFLHCPRGADVCFQVLTNHPLADEAFSLEWSDLGKITPEVYQLMIK